MDCDYTKRSYLLPEGCKDLIDVLKLKHKQKFAPYLFAKPPMYWKKTKPGKQPASLPQAWKDFFDTYWKLIYGVAIKAGLNDAEAQEVVQETIIAVAKQMEGFKYDPKIGSFKGWLLHLTRWRIADKMRRRRDNAAPFEPSRQAMQGRIERSREVQAYEEVYRFWVRRSLWSDPCHSDRRDPMIK